MGLRCSVGITKRIIRSPINRRAAPGAPTVGFFSMFAFWMGGGGA